MTGKTISLLLTGVLLLGASSCSSMWKSGATGPAFKAGDYRLGGGAGLNVQSSDFNGTDTDTLAANFDLGRFYSEHLELGVRFGFTSVDAGTAETDTLSTLILGRWYVDSRSATRPWFEIGLGTSNVDTGTVDVSGFLYAIAIGVTQFLNDHVAIEVGLRESIGSYDDGIDSDVLDVNVGLAVFF